MLVSEKAVTGRKKIMIENGNKLPQAIMFDLDDTLCDKAQWLIPAMVHAAHQLHLDPECIHIVANQYVLERGYTDAGLFNHVLVSCGQSDSAVNIRALNQAVNAYTAQPEDMNLYPGVREMLSTLRRRCRLAVIADGPVANQKAKIAALGLEVLLDAVVYSDEFEGAKSRKPDPRPYQSALRKLRTTAEQALFVGDNPFRDFIGATRLGIPSVRVMTGEYSNYQYSNPDNTANYSISSAARLADLLDYMPSEKDPVSQPMGMLPGGAEIVSVI